MRKSFVIVFGLIVVITLFFMATYIISVGKRNAGPSDNDIRIEKITKQARTLQRKLKNVDEEERLKILKHLDGLQMERALVTLFDIKERFKREIWIGTMLYVGLVKETFHKGAKLKFLNEFILDRTKGISIKYCNKQFQKYFSDLIKSLKTCDGQSGKHYQLLSKCFEEKMHSRQNEKRLKPKILKIKTNKVAK